MLGFDWSEMLVIMVVALIAVGPDKLPEVARGLAKAMRQIRRLSSEIRQSINLDELSRHGHDFAGSESTRPFATSSTPMPVLPDYNHYDGPTPPATPPPLAPVTVTVTAGESSAAAAAIPGVAATTPGGAGDGARATALSPAPPTGETPPGGHPPRQPG
ncbi:MAG: twin-arginine translocase TatA/TatE family subunit [Magnetococcales bacterium]|nr:twin-arginine translocase TatA/TatE family subunit [Magnetococcales bacterium]